MTMTMPREQGDNDGSGPGHHQSTPRIQAIERRMQLRMPETDNDVKNDPSAAAPPPAPAPNNLGDDNPATSSLNKNTQLVLHSPNALSSILPSPNIIKQFESDLLKKQAQYSGRISDLDGRLATFHTRLALECAERGREHAFTKEEYVDGPLERAMRRGLDRIQAQFIEPIMDPKRAVTGMQDERSGAGEKQSRSNDDDDDGGDTHDDGCDNHGNNEDVQEVSNGKDNTLPNLVAIERRANLLEAQMNHQAHVTLFHLKRDNFDVVDKCCCATLQPAFALEMTKADKREGKMIRRFEASSGEYARLASEVTASRVSTLGYLARQIEAWEIGDATRAEQYLEAIRDLKREVLEEKVERRKQDRMVVESIVKTKTIFEETILPIL